MCNALYALLGWQPVLPCLSLPKAFPGQARVILKKV